MALILVGGRLAILTRPLVAALQGVEVSGPVAVNLLRGPTGRDASRIGVAIRRKNRKAFRHHDLRFSSPGPAHGLLKAPLH